MDGNKIFLQLIDGFPYPIAVFRRSGILIMANQALLQEAGISTRDISEGRINMLNRITIENYSVLEAMEDVFLGESTALSGLINPLSILAKDDGFIPTAGLQKAIFFPIIGNSGSIIYGAAMFMK